MALKTGEIRALITGDYTSFKRATTNAKREAKNTRDELSKPIIVTGDAKKLLTVLGGLPAAGAAAGAGMAAGLAAPVAVFSAIGAAAIASNADVRAAFSDTAEYVSESVKAAATPMIPYVIGVADQIEQRFNKLRPQLDAAFQEAGPSVAILADGVLDFADNAMPGMVASIQRGRPVVDGFARFLGQTGQGVSDMMTEWADSSHSAGQALDDLGGTVRDALGFIGRLTAQVADDFGPRFTQVKEILGDVEDAVGDVAEGALPVLSGAVGLVLDGAGALLGIVGGLAEGFSDLPAPIQASLLGLIAWRAMQSRIVGEHASLGSRLAEPWKRFGDEVRVQTALAAASGHENLGRLAASMAVVEARVPFIGRMGEAYRNASTSVVEYVQAHRGVAETAGAVDTAAGAVTRLGGAAVGTAAAIGSGLKSAATGLIGVLGGPWGLALTAGAALLGVWVSKQQEATARQREAAAAAQAYANALRESNGAITDGIRRMAADNAEKKGALKTAKELGLSLSDVTAAVMNQGGAYDNVRAKLQALIKEHSHQVIVSEGAKSGITQYKTELDDTGKKAQTLLNDLGGLNSEWVNGTASAGRLAEATGQVSAEMGKAPSAASPMTEAIKKMSEAGASAEEKISALKSALDELTGRKHTVEEANQAVNDSLRDMGTSFKEATDEAKKHKTGLLDSTGAINTVTAAGSALQDNVMQLADAYRGQYAAALEAAQAQGKTLPEASVIAAAAAATTRDRFVEVAARFLGSKAAAEQLATQYGLMPTAQATQITQPGMENAQIAMNLLRDYVLRVPGDKSIIVSSNAAPIIDTIRDLGFRVEQLPDGNFKVIADTAGAQNTITSFVQDNQGRTITIKVNTVTGVSTHTVNGHSVRLQGTGQVMEYYAAGGLRPMSARSSAIVAPYTRTGVIRGIGDNPVADEAFIVLQRHNARSQTILDEVLHRMRPEMFTRPSIPAQREAHASGGPMPRGIRAGDNSRNATYNIYGHSSNDIVRKLDEQRRREELLYGP